MASIEVNQAAPDFEMSDYQGNQFKLSSHKGSKHVLIVLNRGFI